MFNTMITKSLQFSYRIKPLIIVVVITIIIIIINVTVTRTNCLFHLLVGLSGIFYTSAYNYVTPCLSFLELFTDILDILFCELCFFIIIVSHVFLV
jgi:hypothetical protein